MLEDVRVLLKEKLKQSIQGISVYKGRKDKIKIGGVSFNTVDLFLKKESYFISNRTAIKLINHVGIQIDKQYFKTNNIIRLSNGETEQV